MVNLNHLDLSTSRVGRKEENGDWQFINTSHWCDLNLEKSLLKEELKFHDSLMGRLDDFNEHRNTFEEKRILFQFIFFFLNLDLLTLHTDKALGVFKHYQNSNIRLWRHILFSFQILLWVECFFGFFFNPQMRNNF